MKTMSPSLALSRRLLRPWLLAVTLVCWAAAGVQASQAIIHFQVGDTKEDQLVTIDLFDANAPQTVANFKNLVAKKFYNGMVVHRIIPETLVQAGDPLSKKKDRAATGTGGPGYTLPAEIGRKHVRGAVAMAALPATTWPPWGRALGAGCAAAGTTKARLIAACSAAP